MNPFATTADWLAIILSPEGIVSLVSPGTGRLLGGRPSDMIGQPVTVFLADNSAYDFPGILRNARDSGIWDGEIVGRDSGGNEIRMKAAITPFVGRSKQVAGFSLIAAPEQEDEDDESRSEFVYHVGAKLRSLAHELNNPLAGIMGFSQLIMLDKQCDGNLRSHMEKVYAELHTLIDLVEKLHNYAVELQQK